MLYGQDVANHIAFDQLLEKHVVRAVSEDMAGREHGSCTGCLRAFEGTINASAVFEVRCQRLFAHDVNPEGRQRLNNANMCMVQRANESAIDSGRRLVTGSLTFSAAIFVFHEALPRLELLVFP